MARVRTFRFSPLFGILTGLLGIATGGCRSSATSSRPFRPLAASSLTSLTAGAPFTVVVFFSAQCPCHKAHDDRLRALATVYARRGVRFVLVNAEADSSINSDAREAQSRRYPFPILSDPKGIWADALGAEYATYAVILDGQQQPRYRGGIDSDKVHLTANARFYVRDALDDLLAGQEPRVHEGKTLGCALRRR